MPQATSNTAQRDDQWMKEIAKGCSKSFALLFEAHGSLVLGYAKRLMKDQNTAEDISQEVWMKVVRASSTYQGQGHFKAWLLTLTRNLCFNKLKADQRLQFTDNTEELTLNTDQETESLETQMLFESHLTQIKEAIDDLPENQRLALTLLVVEDLSYESISDHLEISVSATKSLIHRARQNVIKKLKDKEEASWTAKMNG